MNCSKCPAKAGPWFFGAPGPDGLPEGPFCSSCWHPYYQANADRLRLVNGVPQSFRRS